MISSSETDFLPNSRELLAAIQEGVWLTDKDDRVVLVNPALATLLGYRNPEALIGRDWHDFFPPGEAARFVKAQARVHDEDTGGRALGFSPVLSNLLTRDGQQVAVKVALARLAANGATRYLGSVVEVCREQSGGILADPASRQVIEHSLDGICIIRDGKVSYANRRFEKLTGYSQQQMAQIGLERLVVPADRERITRAVADPSRMLAPVRHTVRLVTRTAHEIDCELDIVTAESDGSNILVCFLRDVTELRHTIQARTDFVAMVSHELRNPLAAIKEAVSLVSDTLGTDIGEKPCRYLAIAQEEISRLNRMISNLLEVARVESGKLQLALGAVDLRDCIGKTVDSMALLLNKKRLRVDLLLPDDLPPVTGDADRLRLVFNNLLDNAIKYTPTGSSIRISAQRLQPDSPLMAEDSLLPDIPYVQVVVSDSGPGIPAEFLERVFGKYERVDPHGPGIGLGLAIVRSVIEMHHGKVWVRSNLGEGTSFNVILPAGTTQAENGRFLSQ